MEDTTVNQSQASAGQPRKYPSPELMQSAIDQYFEKCTVEKKRPLVTGLALALGFESRQSLYDYEKLPEYSYMIKTAKLRIESSYEEMLGNQAVTGAIFALKNMGWRDKVETGFTDNEGNDVETVVYRIPDNGRFKKEDTATAAGVPGEGTEQSS